MLFFAFFTLQSFQPADSTSINLQDLKMKLYTANYTYPYENIYLHIDRPSYWANDDIWIKAYLRSTEKRNNIYFELINSSGKVVQKKMYLCLNGLAYGDIHLPDTISSGVYQLRAYTNWMRNFDEGSFFHKNFIVWNLKDREIDSQTQSLKAKAVDVQFFPEGGSLLAGVASKFGIKAVDENGIGVDVSGVIVDDDEKMVTGFASKFKGMGSVSFVPEMGKKYTALVNVFGKTKRINLPQAQPNGIALSMETRLSENLQIMVTEHAAPQTSNHLYYVFGQTRGIPIFNESIDLSQGKYGLKINKNKLPTGVLQVTVFDSNMIPLCERLTFINHNDYVHVSINTDKKTYKTREAVKLDIRSLINDSLPIIANLSISAYTTDTYLKLEEYPNNILSHFLLTADIKGRIEEPAYYFKDQSRETLDALDNLMLTQGWRRFSWNTILNGNFPPITFEHEATITIRGQVTTKFFEKPLYNSTVSLFFDEKNYKYYQQNTDSLGQFLFDDIYFFDETSVLLTAEKENGRKNTWMEVDDRSQKSPEVSLLPVDYLLQNNQKVKTTYEVSVNNSEMISRKWHITDTILLDDIDIFGIKKKDPKDDGSLLFDIHDFSLKITEDNDMATDVFDLIQYRLPGVQVRFDGEFGAAPSIRLSGNQGPPLLLLDGYPIDATILQAMPVSSFEKVDMLRMASIYGSKGVNGAIMFTSRQGGGNVEVNLPSGMERLNVLGYSVVREFYSPNYEHEDHTIEKTDFRSTVYWHPDIWTDENGKATIDFYNSDQPGEIHIVVEGFSTDGRLCRGTYSYNVRP